MFIVAYPNFWFVDDVITLKADGTQVQMAPGSEDRHHVRNDNVQCHIVTLFHGFHETSLDGINLYFYKRMSLSNVT